MQSPWSIWWPTATPRFHRDWGSPAIVACQQILGCRHGWELLAPKNPSQEDPVVHLQGNGMNRTWIQMIKWWCPTIPSSCLKAHVWSCHSDHEASHPVPSEPEALDRFSNAKDAKRSKGSRERRGTTSRTEKFSRTRNKLYSIDLVLLLILCDFVVHILL